MTKLRVDIRLKAGVLDPQGKAVAMALHGLGFDSVGDVRVGKVIELELADVDATEAIKIGTAMAEKLLANLVIEDYSISIV